ncbi:MFS transporter [Photobacterium sp. ZSDE20]|uniref:MFS transporter n=1 Tax=Photobacterium pectinilyticum TaxID=2906793 RepID=A0ABT1N6B4_9GAMM|nr:MFS transporter [Photobacterium sp. ZSDE20]MCQ1060293.1 MFS transporter [Photobacterium sp. ZSDE20]MDD1827591.1 MFS transporter [Photobacterium sp. ZSDE20]
MSEVTVTGSKPNEGLAKKIWYYSIGEGGTSIGTNGINNFALLFYTQVLGLNASLAGLALSISILWDAISDPMMGYISDNTKSRYGKRHIYMFIGGLLLSVSFMALWMVPESFTKSSSVLFAYLLFVNLILRTSLTIFVVPYTALGFEVCRGYESRAKLQSIRSFLNMCVNFIFGALAWTLFFSDSVNEMGVRIDGTKNPDNFITMGLTLGLVALILIMLCTFLTREYAKSSENEKKNAGFKEFIKSTKDILSDKMAFKVFCLLFVAQIGTMLTAQLQIFSYVEFMSFSSAEKTFVHGSTMIGFALGALSITSLVNYLEKKYIVFIAVSVSSLGGILMYLVFAIDVLSLDLVNNKDNVVTLIFSLFQGMYWVGAGIIIPLAASMVADVSAVNEARTGQSKDGGYSSMFSFAMKSSGSLALLFSGSLLALAGYIEGSSSQTPEVALQIASFAFLVGPIFLTISTVFMKGYNINRDVINQLNKS